MTVTGDWIDRLPDVAEAMGRSSTAERVADMLRELVIDGALAPGTRLSEQKISEKFKVSRNTLREAFRLLGHERLLVHEFNRGVFVAKPGLDDVVDLYRARRPLELAAVRGAASAPAGAVGAVRAAVEEGEAAEARGDWWGIGTANMHFHQAIGELAGSTRVAEVMRQLLAEMRLAFHVMAAPREFHAPYLDENRAIYERLADGRFEEAAERLAAYFDRAEDQLVRAFAPSR
ncbi:GntR family transcriptional regulator [Actinorugispora endophytica]|uniref:GntR family transcriptional regulator n=1 Tax=Actinorugispora endophytica TaxID=1605990 RepID=A0A4R6URM8_9ACTN|nr:GntR family transcriptional regulator [Actinorugispora endophytica]TDQ45964.1 GntR family transcriptional regulator [Actinorugispora endophytica]